MTENYEDDEDIEDLSPSTQLNLAMLEQLAKPWVPPPKTEMQIKMERFAEQIQDITLAPPGSSPDDAMESQLKALDLMFRSLVTEGSPYNGHASFAMALRTQTAYRRTWAALNFFRAHGGDAIALPSARRNAAADDGDGIKK